MYKEIMTNDDNLESNLLTSILLKMLVQVEPEIPSELTAQLESYYYLYKWCQVNYSAGIDSIGYYNLHRSIMGCSLMVTRAGVAC